MSVFARDIGLEVGVAEEEKLEEEEEQTMDLETMSPPTTRTWTSDPASSSCSGLAPLYLPLILCSRSVCL